MTATTPMHMVAYQCNNCFRGLLVPVCVPQTLSAIFGGESCSFNLLIVCRWAEVQVLVNSKSLLFYASDAQTKASKVIKYVTQYGHEVHQLLSDAGLAPTLYQLVQLPGGFMQVSPILGQLCCIFVGQFVASFALCQCYLLCCGFREIMTICRWRWSCLLRRMDGRCYQVFHSKICCW